jgi:hypothetical protein
VNYVRAVYGQNVTSEGTVRQWCRMFKDGRINVHDEGRSGGPSVVSDNLFQSESLTISELHLNFYNFNALCYMRLLQLG